MDRDDVVIVEAEPEPQEPGALKEFLFLHGEKVLFFAVLGACLGGLGFLALDRSDEEAIRRARELEGALATGDPSHEAALEEARARGLGLPAGAPPMPEASRLPDASFRPARPQVIVPPPPPPPPTTVWHPARTSLQVAAAIGRVEITAAFGPCGQEELRESPIDRIVTIHRTEETTLLRIERREPGGEWRTVADAAPPSHVDAGLEPRTTYEYRAAARGAHTAEWGPWSEPVRATTPPIFTVGVAYVGRDDRVHLTIHRHESDGSVTDFEVDPSPGDAVGCRRGDCRAPIHAHDFSHPGAGGPVNLDTGYVLESVEPFAGEVDARRCPRGDAPHDPRTVRVNFTGFRIRLRDADGAVREVLFPSPDRLCPLHAER